MRFSFFLYFGDYTIRRKLQFQKMKIAILSRATSLYSTQSLFRAGQRRGHQMQVIDHTLCNLIMEKGSPQIFFQGRKLSGIGAVIPRIGASVTFLGSAVIRQFEMMQVFTSVRSDSLLQARDKLRSLQLLSAAGVDIPKTFYANHNDFLPHLLEEVGGTPVIIKILESTHGVGVILAESKNNAISVIEAFSKTQKKVIVQEFIEEAGGADVRAFIVGGDIVAAMKRQAPEGEFRSNLHRGASAIPIKLTAEEEDIVKKAARVLGLDVAGVDILQSKRGPLVMEVNASPGLEGIENYTKKDVAGAIIDYVSRRAKKWASYKKQREENIW